MGSKGTLSILAWVTREVVSVITFQGMCTRRQKLYVLSERDLYGFCGGTHGSTGNGKTPLADVDWGVFGQ